MPDPNRNPLDRALDVLFALREVQRGPSARHQFEARKIDDLRPYKHEILQALRKTTLEQLAHLLTKCGHEISKPQLARAVQRFKKEIRAERSATPSPTASTPRTKTGPADPKLAELAAQLVALAQGPDTRYPRPAPKQEQLRERREQLLEDRRQGKTIPQIVEKLRKQGINISEAQALRVITLLQKEERAGRSAYNLQQNRESLSVREDAPKGPPHRPLESAKPTNPAKAREDDLEKSIKQARRSAGKAQKSKLPPSNTERTKEGPSRPAPGR